MATTKKPKKANTSGEPTITLTRIQADVLEMYRDGLTERQILDVCQAIGYGSHSSGHHDRVVRLRQKGCISKGQAGAKGSVKVLVPPNAYTIDGELPIPASLRTPLIRAAAKDILENQKWDELPILADLLEENGLDPDGDGNFSEEYWAMKLSLPPEVNFDDLPELEKPKRVTFPDYTGDQAAYEAGVAAYHAYRNAIVRWNDRRHQRLQRLHNSPRALAIKTIKRFLSRLS